ncbi:MAG: hypothetical protein E6J34_21060 [Chloroflexi bacterium]|nr:MAG: hypothetical protein E6J34_21060 [Chloroflexota bacterium]
MFHTTDEELVQALKDPYRKADAKLLADATTALAAATKHLHPNNGTAMVSRTIVMASLVTEARLLLLGKEYEQSAKVAQTALDLAKAAHSKKGEQDIRRIYMMLRELVERNPYVANLAVELNIFPPVTAL